MRIGRRSTRRAAELSRRFRSRDDAALANQRATAASALTAAGALAAVGLYQIGLLRHVPDPPLRIFTSDDVDASGEAYVVGHAPDAILATASAAMTAALAVTGGAGSSRRAWLRMATALATSDAAGGLILFAEQLQVHRRLCSWCTVATLAHLASVPPAIRDAAT